ncbi:hypothetical protein V8G54_035719 [Vigna mungo]|uniref:Secreted protein n=1 Tax=Vigna mungo TaxID=3915 RepID=A0AAQ3RFX7_VIGMU
MCLVALLVQAFQPLPSLLVSPRFVPEHITWPQSIPALLHLRECDIAFHQESSPLSLCSNLFATWSTEQCLLLLPQNSPLAFYQLVVLATPLQSCIHHFSHQLSTCMHIL